MENKTEVVTRGKTPSELIEFALLNKGNLVELEKLLEIQIKYEANEARKSYHVAMSAFKAAPIEINKDKEVAYGNTKYKHATLANVVRTINNELSKHGLSASWVTNQKEKEVSVTCKITHVLGHSEETTLTGPLDTSGSKNAIQSVGSTITYLQRYTLLSLTGLATSEQDDDGNAATHLINEWQIGDLRDLLKKEGKTEAKLLEYMGVEKMEMIKAADYKKAENAIKSAKKKEA